MTRKRLTQLPARALLFVLTCVCAASACSTYRNDRDRAAFWRRDQEKRFGAELVLLMPRGYELRLYENLNPLQFHGTARPNAHLKPQLKVRAPLVPGDVTEVIADRKGDSIVLVEKAGNGPSPNSDSQPDPVPAYILAEGGRLTLINIHSYGGGRMRIEAESETDRRAYYAWVVTKIRIKAE